MILPFAVIKFLLDLNLQLRKKERQRALVSCSENFKNKHVVTAPSLLRCYSTLFWTLAHKQITHMWEENLRANS